MISAQTTRPSHVVLVISSLGPGGAERVMSIMANYWAERGWRIDLLTLDDGGRAPHYSLHSDIVHRPLGVAGGSVNLASAILGNLQRVRKLRRVIRERAPDAVISFGATTNILVLLAALRSGIPVIVSDRADPAEHSIGRSWGLLRRIMYPRAARVIVQTRAVAGRLADKAFWNVSVVPNPVPAAEFPPPPLPNRVPGSRTIAAMGRLVPQKGFDLLIAAFARLAEARPEWSLVIWGEGAERAALEGLLERSGLSGRVTLPGTTANAETALRAADIFVLSSRFEGFPNALCEAMACGLPVVSTDCPSGPAEIVQDGVDALLVPSEDTAALATAMDRLMGDDGLRSRLGEAARNVSRRFNVPHVMSLWESVIAEVTGA